MLTRGMAQGPSVVMAAPGTSEKLKVFVSYSRRDSTEFADELVNGLKLVGSWAQR